MEYRIHLRLTSRSGEVQGVVPLEAAIAGGYVFPEFEIEYEPGQRQSRS